GAQLFDAELSFLDIALLVRTADHTPIIIDLHWHLCGIKTVMNDSELARLGRRTMIDIAQRRQRPGSGSIASRGNGIHMNWPDLTETFNGISWAIAGAVATRS